MPTGSAESALIAFRELLSAAIARGRRPQRSGALGPATWTAIDAVAREHPDADPEHIVAAYEAFAIEHPQCCDVA
jgi:hypothetical protein